MNGPRINFVRAFTLVELLVVDCYHCRARISSAPGFVQGAGAGDAVDLHVQFPASKASRS